jgi:hypothetical protein
MDSMGLAVYTMHKHEHSLRQANEAKLSHQHTRIVLTEAKDQLRKWLPGAHHKQFVI